MAKKVEVGVHFKGSQTVTPAAKQATQAVTGLNKKVKESKRWLQNHTLAIGAAVAAMYTFARVTKELISAFTEQEAAEAKFAAALRITDRETDVSTAAIADLAKELQSVTVYGDEMTLSAAAILQQLANLNQEGLEKTIPLVQDFAASMNVSLQTAAELIGKTLGSTTNALTRYGVVVDMSGTKQEKLSNITAALDEKFGGMAEAIGETTLGKVTQLSNAFGDMKESLGGLLAMSVEGFITGITRVMSETTNAINRTIELMELQKVALTNLGMHERIRKAQLELEGYRDLLEFMKSNKPGVLGPGRAMMIDQLREKWGLGAFEELKPEMIQTTIDSITLSLEIMTKQIERMPTSTNVPGLPPSTVIGDTAEKIDAVSESYKNLWAKVMGPSSVTAGARGMGGLSFLEGAMGAGMGPGMDTLSPPKAHGMAGGETGGAFAGTKEGMKDALEINKEITQEMLNQATYADMIGGAFGDMISGATTFLDVMKDVAATVMRTAGYAMLSNPATFAIGLALIAGGAFVGSFQHGGVVPETGMAYVHKGETITPAGGVSGTTIVNHIYGNVWTEEDLTARVRYGR